MWLLDALQQRKDCDDIAVVHRDEKVSFKELWQRSEAFAGFLLDNTALRQHKTPLVIYGNKDIDIIVAMHAALKIGIPYVPVDTSYPVERLVKIMKQVKAEVLIDFSGLEIPYPVKVYNMSDGGVFLDKYVNYYSSSEMWVQNDDICYILFTSGSTGEPKGVPIRKSNIVNFVKWYEKYAHKDYVRVALNQVSYSFDVSLIPLYVYLPDGIRLFSVDKEMLSDFSLFFCFLKTSELDVWISTPALIDLCLVENSFNCLILPRLKYMSLAGEILTKELLNKLQGVFPGITVINGYGPTECTVLLSACEITSEMMVDEQSLPIGYLLDDATYVLENAFDDGDKHIGELSVVTASAGGCYYRDEERTKEKFWYDEERGLYGYRTGDLVYQRNGLFYYVGRLDSQIKLNGYRIELDDISENINKLEYVNASVVLPVKGSTGKVEYLLAVITLKQDLGLSRLRLAIKVKHDLAKLVPVYMVPKQIVAVTQFPLNVNGKIDKKKLLEELSK